MEYEDDLLINSKDLCDSCQKCWYCCPMQTSFENFTREYGEGYVVTVNKCRDFMEYGGDEN